MAKLTMFDVVDIKSLVLDFGHEKFVNGLEGNVVPLDESKGYKAICDRLDELKKEE